MKIRRLALSYSGNDSMYHFYRNNLQLETEKTDLGFNVVIGTSIIEFIRSPRFTGGYHFAFNIPPFTASLAAEWLKKRTTLLYSYDDDSYITEFPNWKAQAIYFTDPDENIVELISREEYGEPLEIEFSHNSLLNISEIGVGCKDVKSIGLDLNVQTDILNYTIPNENFLAMGNPEGLFIISSIKRKWYPSTRSVKVLDFSADVEINKISYKIDYGKLLEIVKLK